MDQKEIIVTADGSKTIYLPELDETYHSVHGALREAEHVFIGKGYEYFRQSPAVDILETGFGSGLNVLLTFLKSEPGQQLNYMSLEKYPLSADVIESLGYAAELEKRFGADVNILYQKILTSPWEKWVEIEEGLRLKKVHADFLDFNYPEEKFHLVYFDAFGPRVQPELWTEELFGKIYASMKSGGRLVTYSSKGSVRRAMQEVGFEVEKHPGPPGKREMVVALKREIGFNNGGEKSHGPNYKSKI